MNNEPTTSRDAYDDFNTDIASALPMNLSPWVDIADQNNISPNIETKPAEEKPLVIL